MEPYSNISPILIMPDLLACKYNKKYSRTLPRCSYRHQEELVGRNIIVGPAPHLVKPIPSFNEVSRSTPENCDG